MTSIELVAGVVAALSTGALGWSAGAHEGKKKGIQRALESNGAVMQANEQLLAHALTKLEAAEQLTAELRSDLRDSERKRIDVGSVIGQVCAERQIIESLHSNLAAGCARAQHMLMLEIERLSQLARRPVAPHIQQVMAETNGLVQKPLPAGTPRAEAEARIAAIADPKQPPRA